MAAMTTHARDLQAHFLDALARSAAKGLKPLLDPRRDPIGRFLTFDTPRAGDIASALDRRDIIVDHRGTRLRVGFGIYQDKNDCDRLAAAFTEI